MEGAVRREIEKFRGGGEWHDRKALSISMDMAAWRTDEIGSLILLKG